MEDRLKLLLVDWKDNKHKEMYVMHYENLCKIVCFICANYTKEIKGVNHFIRNIMCESFSKKSAVPEVYDISLFDSTDKKN